MSSEASDLLKGLNELPTSDPKNPAPNPFIEGKYLRFEAVARKPKTRIWAVLSKESGDALGLVQWFGRWRCYSFFPAKDTLFEQRCLRDIAAFCEEQTRMQRTGTA